MNPISKQGKVTTLCEGAEEPQGKDMLQAVADDVWRQEIERASPIVTIPKKPSGIRLCVDLKVSLNNVLDVDLYPL
ncbi:hypothetical protein PR048_025511 [Dryococelus australis]|uniref:Uncharacterized protein n=1 Tax=Dryococelus australis TaxID=614101 RepID=A0ABQ9GRG5_9NEOP|nr:hypothetical protein PR048_025511 [Dryococelus australis]